MDQHTIILGGINYYFTIKFKPIRKIYFRYNDKCFNVTAPFATSKKEIVHFFENNEARLLQLTKHEIFPIEDGTILQLLGETYSLKFGTKPEKKDKVLVVESAKSVDQIFSLMLPTLDMYVKNRLAYFHALMFPNLLLPDVNYKHVKRYYGLYRLKKHQITLNYNLVFLDLAAIDCILVHELAHIRFQNHQKAFYQLVLSILPDYRQKIKKIRKEGLIL